MSTLASKKLLLHVPGTVNIFLYQNCYYAAFIGAGFIILHCEIALQWITTARRTYICIIYTYIIHIIYVYTSFAATYYIAYTPSH
uniref:Uncharacterized protein n=1 Tax=Theropithecus gelada TaxID=9565 RepID=A0A8D2GCH5_THEGE